MGKQPGTDALAFAFDEAHHLDTDARLDLLGGKGAGLVAMTAAGIPVPPGFTLTTAACRRFLEDGWRPEHTEAVATGIHALEQRTGKMFGSSSAPLLVSVRSGARVSMPGMMDTVLNVGMNDEVEAALARLTGNAAFARDTHRRALLSYAEVVGGATEAQLETAAGQDSVAAVRAALGSFGVTVPTRPIEQVVGATRAVFTSWTSARAVTYRNVEGIPHDIGTAATVQAMVFGNLGLDSGTGVSFTRDPATGAPGLMGDFLAGAQGEDVVAGTHVTQPLQAMAERWPDAWAELQRIATRLEHESADMVDIEFTVESGRLWLLQSRVAKRSPIAALRVAIDMADDPDFPLTRAEAVERCAPYRKSPPLVAAARDEDAIIIATGLAASPGRACGVLCLDPDEAVRLGAEGVDVILARRQTSPADIHGIEVATGLFTTRGGLVSHAAVVARSWGLPAVVGATSVEITDHELVALHHRIPAGTVVTLDGDAGELLLGGADGEGTPAPEVLIIERWARFEEHGADDGEEIDGSSPVGPAETTFAVAHALRIKGFAGAEAVAEMTGLDLDTVVASLDTLVAGDEARFHEARAMWQITPAGREAHRARLAATVAAIDLTALRYADFLAHNTDFKALCSDWQLRDGAPNDHTDPAYDGSIRARLDSFHARAAPVVARTATVLPWAATYPARLRAALDRFAGGDTAAFTGVLCSSYHDVWMELHEDLILTQDIDRAAEGST